MHQQKAIIISLLTFITFSFATNLSAQGIRGNILDENNEPLPFATIYVRNIESGTTSNAEGFFELKLAPGKYDLVFQSMGYETVVKVVDVQNSFVEIDVSLKAQTIMLNTVVVTARKEDPALTIMRKSIAKAKYHVNQLDAYTAKVYTKGSGRLINSPFFLRKKIAKEGIDSTSAFTSESIIEVNYKRPEEYNQRVISIRSNGNANNTSPTPFVNGSFYEPQIADAISPLSPKAFYYYRFVYKGTFIDRDQSISKIQVIPRSKGDDVFAGEINIVEDQWSIHSLDLRTSKFGIRFRVRQIYDPIQEKVWLPISHKFDIEGKVFGFEAEYDYLITMSDYDITINPDLPVEVEVVDDKVNPELAKKIKKEQKEVPDDDFLKAMETKKEITRKDLRKILREYEKKEEAEQEESKQDVVSIMNMTIDSTAYKYDSTYWAEIRPVPLTKYEKKGYIVSDSLAEQNKRAAEGDSTIVGRRKGFGIGDLLFGNRYKVGDKAHVRINNAALTLGFNTVEGFNFKYGLQFTKTFDNLKWLSIEPTVRYAFARNKLLGNLKINWKTSSKEMWTLEGGQEINQFNGNNPILPIINTVSSLFYEQNFMKIYQQDYLRLRLNKTINDHFKFDGSLSYSERTELFNNTDFSISDINDRDYTPNRPDNEELTNTSFRQNNAFISNLTLEYIPFVKYVISNKKKRAITAHSPVLRLNYRSGWDLFDSDTDFSLIDLGIKHSFKTGVTGKLTYKVNGGFFLKDDQLTFIDFRHFMGNRTLLQSSDPVAAFRLLDYYQFSTRGDYITAFAHYDFRKLFLTRLGFIRERGLKEAMFVNYLGTTESGNYTEVGYSINNIYRIFRVEGIASFRNGEYYDWGIRIGLASNLSSFISFGN